MCCVRSRLSFIEVTAWRGSLTFGNRFSIIEGYRLQSDIDNRVQHHANLRRESTCDELAATLGDNGASRNPANSCYVWSRPMADSSITELLKSVDATSDSRLVSVVDKVLEKLTEQKLAWTCRIPPRLVGVHQSNRSGYGVSGPEMHRLGSEVVAMGWSEQACSHAVCAEDTSGQVAAFMEKLWDGTTGLGKVSLSEIKYGSLSCSHTNQFLVAALCGVPSEYSSLTVDGTMNTDKLGRADAALARALEQGMTWLVISAQATSLYPNLCELVQAARNSTGAVHHKEHAFSLMTKVHDMAVQMAKANNGAIDWDSIQRVVSKRAHSTADEVRPLLKFVQKYGGGNEGRFCRDLEEFHKRCVPAGRLIPAATWQSLADLKLAPGELCPFFACAVVKAQAACPDAKVSNNVCRYVTATEISGLNGPKKKAMLAAEGVLRECRTIVANSGVGGAAAVKCLGRLDTLVARLVLGKKDDLKHTTVEGIARDFVNELTAQRPGEALAAGSSTEGAPPAFSNMVQYDEAGTAVGAELLSLQNQGFKVGSVVKNSANKLFTIANLEADGGQVTLHELSHDGSGGTVSKVDYGDFVGCYRVSAVTLEVVADWASKSPQHQSEYRDAVVRAHVLTALAQLGRQGSTGVRVQLKPVRTVFAEEAFAMQKMILVPETTKMSADASKSCFPCQVNVPGGGVFKMTLMPTFGPTFVAPAWAVRSTDNPDQANAAIVKKTVSIVISIGKASEARLQVTVPYLTNVKRLQPQDELFYYKQPETKGTKRSVASISIEPAAKAGKAKAK